MGGALPEALPSRRRRDGALVAAVCRGKLTVATLVPAGVASAKSAAAPAALREGQAVLRAWPVLMAVVREVLPRDTSAETELLRIPVNAFDPATRSTRRTLAPTPSRAWWCRCSIQRDVNQVRQLSSQRWHQADVGESGGGHPS